jgi:hypothetical protein
VKEKQVLLFPMPGSGKTLSCETHSIVITIQSLVGIAIEGEEAQTVVKRNSFSIPDFSNNFKVS